MKYVIQCAAGKRPYAGAMRDGEGNNVAFIAHPELAPPPEKRWRYAKPDDAAMEGHSWRELTQAYNKRDSGNPLGLLAAHELYTNPAYQLLVKHGSIKNVYILSAGWGLIRSDFLTPTYDITFSQSADPWKRRRPRDDYKDFRMIPENGDEPIIFFGGKDYLALFARLTNKWLGRRMAVFNSQSQPGMSGIEFIRFPTTARTNWHDQAVVEFVNGRFRPE